MKAILDFVIGILGWAFYISCVPGVALVWLLPTIFLIVNSIRYIKATDNKEKLKKTFIHSLIIFIICISIFIGIMISSINSFGRDYPVM